MVTKEVLPPTVVTAVPTEEATLETDLRLTAQVQVASSMPIKL